MTLFAACDENALGDVTVCLLWILRRDPFGSRSVKAHIFGILELARLNFFQRTIVAEKALQIARLRR